MAGQQTSTHTRSLIISDGSLAALVACAAARESLIASGGDEKSPRPIVLFTPVGDETNHARRVAIEKHAKLYELDMVDATADLRGPGAHGVNGGGLHQTLALITATYQAAALGCDQVVWPVQIGGQSPDLEAVARVIDRSVLVTRLASLDSVEHGRPAIRIETPYADLSDRQLADLAIDMNAPVEQVWWWGAAQAGKSEHAARELERWFPVLQALGWSPANKKAASAG